MADSINVKVAGQIWVFFNIKTQEQSQPLTQANAQFFILRLKKSELRHYLTWTPGWPNWVPLKEFLKTQTGFFPYPPPIGLVDDDATDVDHPTVQDEKTITNSKIRMNTITNTNSGEHTFTEISLDGEAPSYSGDFQPEVVNWEKTPVIPILKKSTKISSSGDERREYKRFPHRIEIVIMTKKGRSFRSSSQNISLGGAFLREPVPSELLRDVMDLVIINPFPDKNTPSHLLFKGRIVGDVSDRRRLMFYDVSPEIQNKLQSILENYKKGYKEFKRKKSA